MSIVAEQNYSPILPVFPTDWSLADLQRHLGIPAERIRAFPPLGTATEADVERIESTEGRLFELEQGVLVEKTMGWYESALAVLISLEIGIYLRSNDLGKVLGADGCVKLMPGIVKIPDVSFISWSRFPNTKLPRRPIPLLLPDLVVEVLSEANTKIEMDAKLIKYFEAGVQMVWYVDPGTRTARIYNHVNSVQFIASDGELHGGDVLPDFHLSLQTLFEQADRQGPRE